MQAQLTTQLNTNLKLTADAFYATSKWIPSPIKGVERKMLERDGGELAIATTLVKYQANSYFSSHVHTGGEEFLVLEGIFADEHGEYPAGTYIRNPVGTAHAPVVKDGCMILVKLGQFQNADTAPVHINTLEHTFQIDPARSGVSFQALHSFKKESVRLENWQANQIIHHENQGGIEILVVEGSFNHNHIDYNKFDWLRLPIDQPLNAIVPFKNCKVWIKTGHHSHQF